MAFKYNILTLLLLAISLMCYGCAKNVDDEGFVVRYDVAYNDLSVMDIYYYKNGMSERKYPVIIFAHGGGWDGGEKSQWSISHAITAFEKGYISVSVGYSLQKHPSGMEDFADAIRWVYDNIETYGGDKNNLFLCGMSSGAHMVSLIATDNKYLKNQGLSLKDIRAVCSYDAGPYIYSADLLSGASSERFFVNNFGSDRAKWPQVVPYSFISKGNNIPGFVIVAESDVYERIVPNKAFEKKLSDNGIRVKGIYVSGYNHNSIFYEAFFSEEIKNGIFNHFDTFIK